MWQRRVGQQAFENRLRIFVNMCKCFVIGDGVLYINPEFKTTPDGMMSLLYGWSPRYERSVLYKGQPA